MDAPLQRAYVGIDKLGKGNIVVSEDRYAFLLGLHQFIGYGSPTAKLVFLGLEEGGDDSTYDAVRGEFCELGASHRKEDRNALDEIRTQVWTYQAAFALGLLDGRQVSRADALVKHYRNWHLATFPGNTLLTEWSPYRRRSLSHTTIYDSMPSDEKEHARRLFAARHQRMRRHFGETKPRYVLCYGKAYWSQYEEFWSPIVSQWQNEPGVRSLRLARLPWGGVVALTPFFGNGQMSYAKLNAIAEAMKDLRQQSA